ncbi:phage antirepressor [Nocardia puris]|nr:phage antirepressor [Nocardia puris]
MGNDTAQLMPFTYGITLVRVVVIDGEPWFVLADLCKVLDIAQPRNVAARLADDQKGVRQMDTPGGRQGMTIVNESGMYEVVIRSDKPDAVTFRRWITGDVLPMIRKTGSYGAPTMPTGKELLARAILEAADTIKELDAKVAELAPKADFYDELMDANGAYSLLATSKILGWGRNVMMRELRRLGVLQGNNLPYQRYEHHFKIVPGTYVNQKTGETIPTATTFVMPSGIEFLRKKLAKSTVAVSA